MTLKAERIEGKIAELVRLLQDPDLAPILSHLLDDIVGSHNGHTVAFSTNPKNPTYSGIRNAIRELRDKLPPRFNRSQIMEQLARLNFPATNGAVNNALSGLVKQSELKCVTRARGGVQAQYEFTKAS